MYWHALAKLSGNGEGERGWSQKEKFGMGWGAVLGAATMSGT